MDLDGGDFPFLGQILAGGAGQRHVDLQPLHQCGRIQKLVNI
jgi:hypothetical protein